MIRTSTIRPNIAYLTKFVKDKTDLVESIRRVVSENPLYGPAKGIIFVPNQDLAGILFNTLHTHGTGVDRYTSKLTPDEKDRFFHYSTCADKTGQLIDGDQVGANGWLPQWPSRWACMRSMSASSCMHLAHTPSKIIARRPVEPAEMKSRRNASCSPLLHSPRCTLAPSAIPLCNSRENCIRLWCIRSNASAVHCIHIWMGATSRHVPKANSPCAAIVMQGPVYQNIFFFFFPTDQPACDDHMDSASPSETESVSAPDELSTLRETPSSSSTVLTNSTASPSIVSDHRPATGLFQVLPSSPAANITAQLRAVFREASKYCLFCYHLSNGAEKRHVIAECEHLNGRCVVTRPITQ